MHKKTPEISEVLFLCSNNYFLTEESATQVVSHFVVSQVIESCLTAVLSLLTVPSVELDPQDDAITVKIVNAKNTFFILYLLLFLYIIWNDFCLEKN